MTMFLIGIYIYLLVPLEMFEYSYSLGELDLIETAYIVFLVVISYKYIRLCSRVNTSVVRKVITPFVHQAHLMLLLSALFLFCIKIDPQLYWDDLARVPLLDLISYILIAATFTYSYHRIDSQNDDHTATVHAKGAVE
ncbi:hypothetical protein VEZ01S_07_00530 [Vibrio ezurae NBRC 102218]|uniref:Uncharacterized protein n=1 Tax=Vibrio ezurae NBRC 102218 TaxID=1219080 RepID=U3AG45_9VIBR|nr:hypothetical protein VEZ01S_07_00530 [Vibrio ezurae NBRC 102218]